MKRKAQADIIGLMVIVVLLIVILGIYLSLASKPKSSATIDTLTSVQLNTFMESIRDYSVCPNQALEKAAKPCLNGNTDFCGGKACDIMEREMTNIIKAAFPTEIKTKVISIEFRDISDPNNKIVLASSGKIVCVQKGVCDTSEIAAGRGKKADFSMCRCLA